MTKRLPFCIWLATGFLCAAAHEKKSFDPDTIWDWRTATDAQIAPDGKNVVYVLGFNDRMHDAMYANLWMATADGRSNRPLTQGAWKDTSPRWSPDGTRVAYLSTRSGKAQIYVRWMDTGEEARITDLQERPSNLAWSPDGKWIAYTARVPAKPAWSIKQAEKPAGAAWAPPPTVITRLHWRDDGEGLVQPGNIHLFIVPATGGAPRQVSSGDFDHGPGDPSWTPDGKTIVLSAQRIQDADYSLEGPEIFAFSVAEGSAKQLTHRSGPDLTPIVSPGGTKILYTGYDYKRQSYTVTRLYVMDVDGGNPRLVTATHDRDVANPHWSGDGKAIFFTSDDRGGSQLYRADWASGEVKPVTSGTHRFNAYATTEPFSMTGAGLVAITRTTPSEPPDLYTFHVERPARWTRLTALNESLRADREIGEVEEIRYDSFDGRPIQGWIVKPLRFDASKKYPLILDIHGGPHAMYGVEFANQMQMFAGRGFVVLYVNPRGSTGYGEEFGNIIHARYPGDDYKDLMAGVDFMLARGYVDTKRLAVTGGSGGGLLTAWIIGHTDRFAAAVSQYPVTNWITQAGSADHGLVFSQGWMKAMPWENPKQYIEHSPIFFAEGFHTPTMVITGEEDYRTPMGQSEELFFALKARKVPAVLVRIPDEPHGIRGKHPSHRIAKVEHVLGWIEKYTQP